VRHFSVPNFSVSFFVLFSLCVFAPLRDSFWSIAEDTNHETPGASPAATKENRERREPDES
jgi:hypothetical protein